MTQPDLTRRWLSRESAATYLDCVTSTIDRLADGGRLTRYKVGGLSRFDAREIDALVLDGDPAKTPAGV